MNIAEVFGIEHKEVLRAIRNLECSEDFNQRNFALVKYQDKKGEMRPMYDITRDGFVLLVMDTPGRTPQFCGVLIRNRIGQVPVHSLFRLTKLANGGSVTGGTPASGATGGRRVRIWE